MDDSSQLKKDQCKKKFVVAEVESIIVYLFLRQSNLELR